MHLVTWYQQHKDKWWCLPLFLPLILLPIARLANIHAQIGEGVVVLYFLPLALMITLMLFFGWAAIPGMILAIILNYRHNVGFLDLSVTIIHFLLSVIVSWGGYRVFETRRFATSYGLGKVNIQRMFWLVFCNASVFMMFYQFASFFGLYDTTASLIGENPFNIRALVNYQGVLVGCLTGVPLCYLVIRAIRHPRYLRAFFSQMKRQCDVRVKRAEVVLWFFILAVMVSLLLTVPGEKNTSLFTTSYTLSLLLPVMLWGAIRFGYLFISLVWSLLLLLLCHYYERYLPPSPGSELQIVISSSCYFVYSLTIMVMGKVATWQRNIYNRSKLLAYIDPLVHMPNLRALNHDLGKYPWSMLCFLRVPELELLGRHYGVSLRIHYKQQLASWLREELNEDELAYQLSGHDLVIRLNTHNHEERIAKIHEKVNAFRLIWDGMPIQPQVGISYCFLRSPVNHLHILLGEMSSIADVSLSTHHPESLQRRGGNHLQRTVKTKVEMMNRLQIALDNDQFRLLIQRVEGVRGDCYYEVLLRMLNEKGELLMPADFLPVASEFGFSSRIDLWVLEKALSFIDHHRSVLPGYRFAINLTPSSVCRVPFAGEVKALLAKYQVEPWQLIFEVTDSQSLSNIDQVNLTLTALRNLGCRIAIDDFGTGYSSYARFRNLTADILKIDGSFVRNLLSSSMDYQIVASICTLARMKNMQVVAEYVESEEVRKALLTLGIDYQQGYFISKPEPIESLVTSAR
ncbi:EAL domain-containing protein [Atlantibacter hermannii]|uniref:EAL domain-containing protein n=1 Tax=Atlantibacter hermannii TaxID=565 RepID=UPI002898F60C|nr:EAL domain-containing protein [Atlantibacter hermannii]